MKKSILMSMLLMSLAFASTGWSLTITSGLYLGTDVGAQDTLIGQDHLDNSGEATELAWAQSLVIGTVTLDKKYDSLESKWMLTDAANVYALNLVGSPAYFLIKTGKAGNTGSQSKTDKPKDKSIDYFLFKNEGLLDWAVIDFGVNGVAIYEAKEISHVDEFGTVTTPVPEPGTFVLLGAGLFGLAIYGKRRRNA